MTKTFKFILLGTFCSLVALSLPISNLFLKSELPLGVKNTDPEFIPLAKVMQSTCADCHSPNETKFPIYANLPIAKQIIEEDIKSAQNALILSKEELTGQKNLSAVKVGKMFRAIADGSMPPAKYWLMHWDSRITGKVKDDILKYLEQISSNRGIVPIPNSNPFELDMKKVALGNKLFNDTKLSANNTISCASCHIIEKGGVDNKVVSVGINGNLGDINAPTVLNACFNFCQFWDGRAANLKEQAAGPINNPKEMGSNFEEVISKLNKDGNYPLLFQEAYHSKINKENITDAIAQFEQSLITPNSRFDRYLRGDKAALSQDEEAGYKLFLSNNCSMCHTGVNLGGESFEKLGVRKDYFAWRGRNITKADLGRYNVTKDPLDKEKFKVPSLRNIALTGPYFHDGSVKDLTSAVKLMAEFELNKSISDTDAILISKFLNSLTGELKKQEKN